MQSYLSFFMMSILLLVATIVEGQKNIMISEELSANAEKYDIKPGSRMSKSEFADYKIINSKVGGTTTTTRGNFWGTKSSSNSKQKFSFTMANRFDTVEVFAARYDTVKSTHEFRISPNVSVGSDKIQEWSRSFEATLIINSDTGTAWSLLINDETGFDLQGKYNGYLQNRDRQIGLIPVSSNKNQSDTRMIPALGFEFVENNKSIAALQYYGGGLLGRNRMIAWIDNRLDRKTKSILSAVMMAIVQQKQMDA